MHIYIKREGWETGVQHVALVAKVHCPGRFASKERLFF